MALSAIQRLSPIVDPLLTTKVIGFDPNQISALPEGLIRDIPALSRDSAIPTPAQAIQLIESAPVIQYTPKFTSATNAFWSGMKAWLVQGVKGVLSSGASFATTAATELARKPPPPKSQLREATFSGAQPMSIFDDIGGIFGGGSVGAGTDTAFNWNGLLNLGVGLATNALAPQRTSFPASSVAPASMAAVPAIARGAATVGRSLFNRFPNLATGIQRLRNAGQNVSRAKLYSVMKRFGPEFLISGGLLTAAAVQELAVAGSGRRRMNPANAKALRRSVRRIESFHRLCKSTDIVNSRRRRC